MRDSVRRNTNRMANRLWATGVVAPFAISVMMSGPVAADDSEVRKTWDRAVVVFNLDGIGAHGRMNRQYVQEKLAKIPPGTKLPTIIFIHGCDGLGIETRSPLIQKLEPSTRLSRRTFRDCIISKLQI